METKARGCGEQSKRRRFVLNALLVNQLRSENCPNTRKICFAAEVDPLIRPCEAEIGSEGAQTTAPVSSLLGVARFDRPDKGQCKGAERDSQRPVGQAEKCRDVAQSACRCSIRHQT